MSNVFPFEFHRPVRRLDAPTVPAVYTVKEVAFLLGLSIGGAYEAVREGAIPAERLGRRWVIPRARFHAWLDGRADELPADLSATHDEYDSPRRGA